MKKKIIISLLLQAPQIKLPNNVFPLETKIERNLPKFINNIYCNWVGNQFEYTVFYQLLVRVRCLGQRSVGALSREYWALSAEQFEEST